MLKRQNVETVYENTRMEGSLLGSWHIVNLIFYSLSTQTVNGGGSVEAFECPNAA